MNAPAPLWVDALTALLVVVGALAALIGSFGLLRLKSFFQRVHAPTLGATVGTWCLTLATVVQVSFVPGSSTFMPCSSPCSSPSPRRSPPVPDASRAVPSAPARRGDSGEVASGVQEPGSLNPTTCHECLKTWRVS